MKRSGVDRKEIFLETKLWPAFYEQADAVDKTLERLGTDYIDLLLIHQPAGNYVAGYKLMEKAYKEGKVRAIGLSNFSTEQIQEILGLCEVKPAVLQTEVHPYSQEKKLKEFLAREGIVIQAWYPLGHGDKALIQEPLFTQLGQKYGKSNAQIILRWHIQAGDIVIPGSKNPAHIRLRPDRGRDAEDCGNGPAEALLPQHPRDAEEIRSDRPRRGRAEVNLRFPFLLAFGGPVPRCEAGPPGAFWHRGREKQSDL